MKLCTDLPIVLSKLSEKLGGYRSLCNNENGANDVALSCKCNIMFDDWIFICLKSLNVSDSFLVSLSVS